MIRGITVTLWERVQTGEDGFRQPIWEDVPVQVPGVLVSPVTTEASSDVISALQLDGRHAVYELSIPKEDAHAWAGCRVDFFGQSFRVFGPVLEYVEANVPGPWNRKAKVEKFE